MSEPENETDQSQGSRAYVLKDLLGRIEDGLPLFEEGADGPGVARLIWTQDAPDFWGSEVGTFTEFLARHPPTRPTTEKLLQQLRALERLRALADSLHWRPFRLTTGHMELWSTSPSRGGERLEAEQSKLGAGESDQGFDASGATALAVQLRAAQLQLDEGNESLDAILETSYGQV